ncbi:unnamed protein product (macronuclear) [Paramecium tetraurelia]|uniref:Anamorsin homolog 2 n=1 Tax=Paramecium tetraurelia TaxID=5888 RepID=DRE22_PARTE|nr:uncharacterized protein GSPATT00007825001 [Paramecium tetraurelia]A0CIS3.1 RecName: Full=Anamorsin homolog 2; AltName: Full=Fe-S cluster assembly protein DRE2 homolog 2 [Paramecium tetraurelia]CAK70690.1 unnamed protein product [Paramecium tetraurelia]|eukprot:XP_001438087.1 hypothetical protein (macronuclear) [Paramecium tetraurelia strain d4-2]
MNLKITINQQASISEKLIIANLEQLLIFRDNTFNKIDCDQQITLKDAVQISQILNDQGVLNYEGEINEQITTYLEACGLYSQGQGQFIKRTLQTKKINIPQQDFNNCYGKYDYIEQKFQNQINFFKQVDLKGNQETIDENELLNDGVEVKQVESCASKPRACANCTCGRKEMEEKQDKEQLLEQLKNNSVKGCGSCYLGDAFRCANCPFRGLPAFKDGEQVKVLQDDVFLKEKEETDQIKLENGKVKLMI